MLFFQDLPIKSNHSIILKINVFFSMLDFFYKVNLIKVDRNSKRILLVINLDIQKFLLLFKSFYPPFLINYKKEFMIFLKNDKIFIMIY